MDTQKILKNKPSGKFWRVNISVWGVAAVINLIMQYLGTDSLVRSMYSIIPVLFCFLFTTILRFYWGSNDIYSTRLPKLVIILIPQFIIITLLIVASGIGSIILIRGYEGNLTKLLINNFLSLLPVIMLWGAVYFVIIYYQSMRKSEMDKLRLQFLLQNAELNNLKAQLNPHFLFNALNNIRGLITEDGERARMMISSVTDILRYSLKTQNEPKILLLQEIRFIEEYLKLEHLHMEDRLKYTITADERALYLQIPPMTIQLLVENAVKHGLSKIPEGGILNISCRTEGESLYIDVVNTGSLQSKNGNSTLGVGLVNLNERLKLLYKENALFKISTEGNTVRASLLIPAEVKK